MGDKITLETNNASVLYSIDCDVAVSYMELQAPLLSVSLGLFHVLWIDIGPTTEWPFVLFFMQGLKAVDNGCKKGGSDNQGGWRQCITHFQVPYQHTAELTLG